MKIKDVVQFFTEVDRRLEFPIEVILTGGAAGVLYGLKRATYDIDFEIRILKPGNNKTHWTDIQKILDEVSRLTRITPQYADDIDRWSAIALPSKSNKRFQKIGKVDIRLLDPILWSIGKLTRFLDADIDDLVSVLKQTKPNPQSCAKTWGTALRMSPPSPAQSLFVKQVNYFLDTYARKIWGEKINSEKLKAGFLQAASER